MMIKFTPPAKSVNLSSWKMAAIRKNIICIATVTIALIAKWSSSIIWTAIVELLCQPLSTSQLNDFSFKWLTHYSTQCHTLLFLICCQFQLFRMIADSRSLNGNSDPTIHCCSVNTTTANYCTRTHSTSAEAAMLADWVSRFMPASAGTIINTDGTPGFAFIFIFLRPHSSFFCRFMTFFQLCLHCLFISLDIGGSVNRKRFILFYLFYCFPIERTGGRCINMWKIMQSPYDWEQIEKKNQFHRSIRNLYCSDCFSFGSFLPL